MVSRERGAGIVASSVCIITARGGSKRIPRKNIRSFCGRPIIAYSIEAALGSRLFDEVMVSTDDEEIAAVAKECGASVPFMRSAETSDDYADTADVIREVLCRYAACGKSFDRFCCIYPTAPFVTAEKLIESERVFSEGGADGVISVVPFSFPPQRGFEVAGGYIKVVDPVAFEMRSQDLSPIFHDCGQFYWRDASSFLQSGELVTSRMAPFLIAEMEAQDIDTESDWELAEVKFQIARRGHGRSF